MLLDTSIIKMVMGFFFVVGVSVVIFVVLRGCGTEKSIAGLYYIFLLYKMIIFFFWRDTFLTINQPVRRKVVVEGGRGDDHYSQYPYYSFFGEKKCVLSERPRDDEDYC